MSKITLQNLFEFAISSYKIDYNYKFVILDEINKIKEINNNEKNSIIKYDFIELNYFYKNPNEEMVFIFPIISDNKWFHLLNCFLILTDKNYLKYNNYERKNLISSYYDKLDNINNNYINYNNFIKSHKYNLIIIKKENDIEIFDNGFDIYMIILLFDEEYFLIYNLINKFYNKNSNFVKYFINYKNNKNEKDEYIELQTNDECELSITELDNNIHNITKLNKDIFIPHKNTSNTENNNKSNNSQNNIKDIIKNTKITLSIKQLQDIATELKIPLISGTLKNGNPKYRTKAELFEDIKNYKQ